MSLASPFDRRSESVCISRTMDTSPSSKDRVCAAKPSLSTLLISMSDIVISYPASAAIPASISRSSSSGSAMSSWARTSGRSERHLAPSTFLFGSRTILWKASRSLSVESTSTLSSSANISLKREISGPPTIHPVLQGSLCLLFESTLIRLPASARDLTRAISCSSPKSLLGSDLSTISEPTGQSARWTEEPVRLLWM